MSHFYRSTDSCIFFDGQTLFVIGYPLPSTADARVGGLLESWLKKPSVELVSYLGPSAISLPAPFNDSFDLIDRLEPDAFDVDIRIALQSSDCLSTRSAKDSIKRIARQALTVRSSHQAYFSAVHIELLRALVEFKSLDITDTAYVVNLHAVLREPSSLIFEVRSDNEVVGFAVTHSYFAGHPFLVGIATRAGIAAVADALYVAIINHYASVGAKYVGLGYGISDGLFRYKTKWGGAEVFAPSYQLIWSRRGLNTAYLCFDWRVRLMFKQLGGTNHTRNEASGA